MAGKNKPKAALIFGGRGMEHDVSVCGAEFVFPLIDEDIYEKIPVYIDKDGTWLIKSDLTAVGGVGCFPAFWQGARGLIGEGGFTPIDVAFPLLHGDFGEDGIVQGALECADIPFVGCDTLTSAVARDKCLVKLIARELKIPTAGWIEHSGCIEESVWLSEKLLGYPVFVKPSRLGSSVGASRANNKDGLTRAIENASSLGSGKVIIEEFIDIEKELECAYYSVSGRTVFTSPGEIVCDGGFYDFRKKYRTGGASVTENSSVDGTTAEKIAEYSKKIAKKIGLRHLSRIDYFLSRDGRLYFNEINTMPGFTERSLYPRLLEKHGIAPRELIRSLLDDARTP